MINEPQKRYPLKRARIDGLPGYEIVSETEKKYVEPPGVDKRVKRIRVFNEKGEIVRTYLEDEMGVPFVDNLGYADRKK